MSVSQALLWEGLALNQYLLDHFLYGSQQLLGCHHAKILLRTLSSYSPATRKLRKSPVSPNMGLTQGCCSSLMLSSTLMTTTTITRCPTWTLMMTATTIVPRSPA